MSDIDWLKESISKIEAEVVAMRAENKADHAKVQAKLAEIELAHTVFKTKVDQKLTYRSTLMAAIAAALPSIGAAIWWVLDKAP